MELVVGLFTAATAAAPAAAGTAAAAGTLATATAGASTALSVLQGVTTAASAIFALGSGFAQSQQEDLAARAEALKIQREELIKIGQLRVAFAGSGIDLSAGQPLALEQSIQQQSDFEQGIARSTGDLRSANARLRGFGQAAGTASQGLISIARRG